MRAGVSLIEAMIAFSLLAGVMMGSTHFIGSMNDSKRVKRLLLTTEELVKRNVTMLESRTLPDLDDISSNGKCEVKYYTFGGELISVPGTYSGFTREIGSDECEIIKQSNIITNKLKKIIKIVMTYRYVKNDEIRFEGEDGNSLKAFMKLPRFRKSAYHVQYSGSFVDGKVTKVRRITVYKKQTYRK